jgi:fumarate hydratase subunit alpha
MRTIKAKLITEAIAELAIKANIHLRKDILDALKKSIRLEKNSKAKNILTILVNNARLAKDKKIAICQDTGIAVVFCEIGHNLKIEGDINKAINDGIKLGYRKGLQIPPLLFTMILSKAIR